MFLKERLAIIEWGKKLYQLGHVRDGMGNISLRTKDGFVVISPSGIPYEERSAEQIPVIDFEGNMVFGSIKPSIEYKLHLEIYKNFKEVKAIIHTHSVYSSVLSVLRKPLPALTESVFLIAPEIPVSQYAPAGTEELAKNVVEAMKKSKAVIMANHGLICAGGSLEEAFRICENVERNAQIYVLALNSGLPIHTIEK
ncbi:class II aldolase/adducin family protein [Pseudothermotoga thermarum]|uniref:Class II aldolase/adducin family protein n=1 Tax=Pseudothermotoga thermarum DSM 5069 TaxID=688269 RepID=F7YUU4_9THEM|nr:class II aldolase/adducin family protein [Pseudothermotoga thermarum]AEH51504.1 class II aldolase/adducin family protein [Pseudothermotoga thermarum DSM 5069]